MLKASRSNARSAQAGFTLVELLVAMGIGVVVVGAGITLLGSTLRSNSTNLQMTRINQDLRGMMTAITSDLRRAGSWAVADDLARISGISDLQLSGTTGTITARSVARGTAAANQAFGAPFTAAILEGRDMVFVIPNSAGTATRYSLVIEDWVDSNTLSLSVPSGVTLPATLVRAGSWTALNPFNGVTLSAGGNCVLFSYDLDLDGVQDSNERFGYRRVSGQTSLQATTTDTACDSGSGWETFSDPNIASIQQFQITQIPTVAATSNLITMQVLEYSVLLGGQLVADSTVSRSERSSVQVRNPRVQ